MIFGAAFISFCVSYIGTFGLGSFTEDVACQDRSKFLCIPEGHHVTDDTKEYGECLHAIDCAMHEDMRVSLDESNAVVTFMHQMIPHHQNAVNMAKLFLKKLNPAQVGDAYTLVDYKQQLCIFV